MGKANTILPGSDKCYEDSGGGVVMEQKAEWSYLRVKDDLIEPGTLCRGMMVKKGPTTKRLKHPCGKDSTYQDPAVALYLMCPVSAKKTIAETRWAKGKLAGRWARMLLVLCGSQQVCVLKWAFKRACKVFSHLSVLKLKAVASPPHGKPQPMI